MEVPESKGSLGPRAWGVRALEVILVLVILALLIATWIPAWIGGQPGASHTP